MNSFVGNLIYSSAFSTFPLSLVKTLSRPSDLLYKSFLALSSLLFFWRGPPSPLLKLSETNHPTCFSRPSLILYFANVPHFFFCCTCTHSFSRIAFSVYLWRCQPSYSFKSLFSPKFSPFSSAISSFIATPPSEVTPCLRRVMSDDRRWTLPRPFPPPATLAAQSFSAISLGLPLPVRLDDVSLGRPCKIDVATSNFFFGPSSPVSKY